MQSVRLAGTDTRREVTPKTKAQKSLTHYEGTDASRLRRGIVRTCKTVCTDTWKVGAPNKITPRETAKESRCEPSRDGTVCVWCRDAAIYRVTRCQALCCRGDAAKRCDHTVLLPCGCGNAKADDTV